MRFVKYAIIECLFGTMRGLQVSVNSSVNSSNMSAGAGDSVGMEVQGVMPNILGYAESYRCAVRTDNWGEKDLHAGVSVPSITRHQLPLNINARMFQDDRSNVNSTRTKCMSLSMGIMSKNLKHKLSGEFCARDEAVSEALSTATSAGLVKDASSDIMAIVSPSTKSSVTYSYTNDTRNNGPSPTRGNLFEGVVEAAFPPGTAQFLRSGISLQMHREVLRPMRVIYSSEEGKPPVFSQAPGLSLSLCSSVATIVPLDIASLLGTKNNSVVKNGPDVLLSDRLYSGNHLFARGFAPNTIGPRAAKGSGGCADGDILGGQLRYNAVAAVSTPIPLDSLAKYGARAFAFCNAAAVLTPSAWHKKDLGQMLSSRSRCSSLSGNGRLLNELASSTRVSVGWGLSLPVGPARLELTYAVPLLKASTDSVRQFQVGLGLSIS